MTGKQIVCAERRLHKLLESHLLGGSYESGALYAFEYAELCAVLRDQLGPSDRDRYLQLKHRPSAPRQTTLWQRTKVAAHIGWKLAGLTIFVVYKIVATVVFFGVVAAILAAIGKHRR